MNTERRILGIHNTPFTDVRTDLEYFREENEGKSNEKGERIYKKGIKKIFTTPSIIYINVYQTVPSKSNNKATNRLHIVYMLYHRHGNLQTTLSIFPLKSKSKENYSEGHVRAQMSWKGVTVNVQQGNSISV